MYYISSDLPVRGSPDSFRYISHHGVLGQKWGVRRYQNPDGSLTAAGKKHYQEDTPNKPSAKEFLDSGKTTGNKIKDIELATQDCWLTPSSGMRSKIGDSADNRRRMREAADLGLEALMAMTGGFGDLAPGDNNSREWFVYEDQTIGMAMVADLINQGYTSKQISRMVSICDYDVSDPNRVSQYDDKLPLGARQALFEIREGYDLIPFAKICEEMKNGKSKQ